MFRNRIRVAVVGLTVAALAVGGCTGPSTSSGTTPDKALNIYLYQEPAGVFSPMAPINGPDGQVMSFIFEGLLGVDPDYKLQPRLAESHEVSADAKTFTFKLRQGLKWSDGTPFTAKDVLFTYNLMANPKTTSSTAGNYTGVEGVADFAAGKATSISGFSAPDDNTFVIKATKPNFGLLALIGSVWILPEHVLGKDSPDAVAKNPFFRKPTVGMGPYTFVDYKTNQYVHVTANPNYRSPAKIKDVYLKPMTSDNATAQLGNGGIDIASYSPTDLGTVSGFSSVSTQEKPGAGFVRIALNQSKPYFKDVKVRQAFLYAIDRKQVVQTVLAGKAEVRLSNFAKANEPAGLNEYAQDVNKAKQLLAEAGWDSNREVQLQWVQGQRDRDATSTIVQSQLAAVGVKVKLTNIQAAEITKTYANKSYDMVLYGGGNYAVDSSTINGITACANAYPAGGNINFFCNPQLDELMAQANATADQAQRKALYDQAAKLENEQVDLMWLYSPYGLWAVNKKVQGFRAPGSQDAVFWDPASWSITG
ncbi:ABC transporter substrate-binding protein [Plantactinospora sp. S1510]|uniref:ABC transporter substrate-binding protein n=1 Tax=Plantactinospora alkalitolerans TaxID=2789879 RepID=A0ABS0GTX6_9ACTN|nr:ABC transporter substrate-binding protein [Plantactinospora alkalitolerans]MBF9129647.1 ABC transporter substrate-binding protein [Plantactinospora alkalitolerans]